MTKSQAIKLARQESKNGRKHVVREDYGRYFVCPMYEPGREGYQADVGYSGLGILVSESM